MNNASPSYPALYVIFTLTQAIRRGIPRQHIWREFRRQHIALQPRLIFWVTLCKQLGILKIVEHELRLTGNTRAWLNKTADQKAIDLIEAWQHAPKNLKARQVRKKLLLKLKYNKPLTTKDKLVIKGLDALGITANNNLTRWGKHFIQNEGKLPSPKPIHSIYAATEGSKRLKSIVGAFLPGEFYMKSGLWSSSSPDYM